MTPEEQPLVSSDIHQHPQSLDVVRRLTSENEALTRDVVRLMEARDAARLQLQAAEKAGTERVAALENEFRIIGNLCSEHGVFANKGLPEYNGGLFAQVRDTLTKYGQGSERVRKLLSARSEETLEQAITRACVGLETLPKMQEERDALAAEVQRLQKLAEDRRVRFTEAQEEIYKLRVRANELEPNHIDLTEWNGLSEDRRVEITHHLRGSLQARMDHRKKALALLAPEMVMRVLKQRQDEDSIAMDVLRSLVLGPTERAAEDVEQET